jgi:cholesterol oxidase
VRRASSKLSAGKGYRVHYRDVASGTDASVVGARVVVAAGTIGTNELLLRCRDVSRTLPNLSPRLGEGYSANGDFLGNIENSGRNLHPWDGPDVTTVLRYKNGGASDAKGANGPNGNDGAHFTVAAPGFTRGVTSVLASLGQPHLNWVRFIAPLLRSSLGAVVPWMFGRGMLAKPLWIPEPNAGDPARMINLFAIGRDNANGRFRMNGAGTLDLEWDYANENRALIDAMTSAMDDIARSLGGTFAPLALWSAFERLLTVHSLGGCRLAESAEKGVVSELGEVFGYPGLFVADGSVIPTAIGFHPVMTIAAVCERIAERVAAS